MGAPHVGFTCGFFVSWCQVFFVNDYYTPAPKIDAWGTRRVVYALLLLSSISTSRAV